MGSQHKEGLGGCCWRPRVPGLPAAQLPCRDQRHWHRGVLGARTNTRTLHAQGGGHTGVSRAGAHPSPQSVGTAWGEMDGHPPGQLYTPAQALGVPADSPGGARTPPLTSWTRVVWQFLRSGPCSSTLGAPGCNDSIMLGAGGTPCTPQPHCPGRGRAWCQGCTLQPDPLALRSPGAG